MAFPQGKKKGEKKKKKRRSYRLRTALCNDVPSTQGTITGAMSAGWGKEKSKAKPATRAAPPCASGGSSFQTRK